MSTTTKRCKVGEVRRSQLLFSYGVGAIVDLPKLSVMVMGLDDWDIAHLEEIGEERLLEAVRGPLGDQVQRLCLPPLEPDTVGFNLSPFASAATIGVPVATFPRWLRCPACDLLAPIRSNLFALKPEPYRVDRVRYIHSNCNKLNQPDVMPARFLVACAHGHLDDFPWITYVHRKHWDCAAILRLSERGVSGGASDVFVKCDTCGDSRPMSDAFGVDADQVMPTCLGRRPHLRDFDEQGCNLPMKSILLGASNSWFAITLSALSIPTEVDTLGLLVEQYWSELKEAESAHDIRLIRKHCPGLINHTNEEIWERMEKRKAAQSAEEPQSPTDLKGPEWQVFSQPDPRRNTSDFRLRAVSAPPGYETSIAQVVLVERLREVQALLGFSRIESPRDFADVGEIPADQRAPISRKRPSWVPVSEVRGEGIFIQFQESALAGWTEGKAAGKRTQEFLEAHRRWRRTRRIEPVDGGFPGIRYVLLHSFAHALMRQLALECGYTAASIRERIYAAGPHEAGGPMAGVLLYTAAPDSEGTLGGLVSLGAPLTLARHLDQAFEQMKLCASDPLCAEHDPSREGITLHGAACHACLFAPETSCERGNKYLDRTVLVSTISRQNIAFFDGEHGQT